MTPPTQIDLLTQPIPLHLDVHQHGHVTLIDMLPRIVPLGATADNAVVDAARLSYGKRTWNATNNSPSPVRDLLRYLLRHGHGSPFEMVTFKFHIKLPIFVARQWIRHRISSLNEISARYTTLPREYFSPSHESCTTQSTKNKQGRSDEPIPECEYSQFIADLHGQSFYDEKMDDMVDRVGLSRELARIGLPLNTYTEWVWQCNLRSLLNFLSLRMDSHAQKEIRDYANAIYTIISPLVPLTIAAFDDYDPRRGAVLFTRLDVSLLAAEMLGDRELWEDTVALMTAREKEEYDAKRNRIQTGWKATPS